MRYFIFVTIAIMFIKCTKESIDNSIEQPEDNDTIPEVDYREALTGEYMFTTRIYSYWIDDYCGDGYYKNTNDGSFDTTIIYKGSIKLLGDSRIYINYMEKENYYAGCLEGNDTLHDGYGIVTPRIDSLNIYTLLNPLGDCFGFDFEGSFITKDSLSFDISGSGGGGGYYEWVSGVRQ